MTISSEVTRNDYVGNGATSVYPYTFRIISSSDLLITQRDTSSVETVLILDVNYTVSGVGSGGGGNVTLTGGNLPSGYALTIRRVRQVLQETDIRNQGAFYPETIEDALDHQVMLIQQSADFIERSLKIPVTEAGSPGATTIPFSADRANMVLGFDSSGNPIAVSNVPTSGVVVSSFMQTVLDDANAAAARTTLVVDNLKGTTAARPAFGNVGRLFLNETLNTIQRDSGTSWSDVGTLIPSGTAMVFYQASAPAGWTKSTAQNDKALRVVSGTGGGTGGTSALSSGLAHTHTVASHTHTLASHTHDLAYNAGAWTGGVERDVQSSGTGAVMKVSVSGGSGGSGRAYYPVTQASSTTDTGGASLSTDSTSPTFQYIDVIVCTKD